MKEKVITKEKTIWTIKHVVIFAVLYALSSVIGEAVVIIGFSGAGYDVLHGEFPTGYWVNLVPLYGMIVFAALTLIYVKLFAKKNLSYIRLTGGKKALLLLLAGMFAGGLVVIAIILILTATGDYRFAGYNGLEPMVAFATLAAYMIQGAAEEIMCRGYLQNFLEEKISRRAAVFVSALAFMAPHLGSMEASAVLVVISICNLLLVAILFSLAMLRWNSLWVSIGIHIGWNYALSYIFGLQLSGMESGSNLFLFQVASGRAWLHGGEYGIEGGVVVTLLLLIVNIVLYLTVGKDKVAE